MSSLLPSRKPVRVMIASTVRDLELYRSEASRLIREIGSRKEFWLQEISMENKTSDGEALLTIAKSKEWVDEADWIILIVGFTYGYVSDEPGAEGLSVTEWEYRHAREPDRKKKIFVFIADEAKKGGYRPKEREATSLLAWGLDETAEGRNKLQAFREELRSGPFKRFVKNFRDIDDFCDKLKHTLDKEIDRQPVEVEPGGGLARLFVTVSRPIKDGIARVQQLANYKGVHDALHDILHRGVRRLVDEVLPGWQDAGSLDRARERRLAQRCSYIGKRLGRLDGLEASLQACRQPGATDDGSLFADLDDLRADFRRLWDEEGDEQPDLDMFTNRLDDFAATAATAFTTADEEMDREERTLSGLYEELIRSISIAKANQHLSDEEHERLDAGVERLRRNKDRLASILATHHDWQHLHDDLQRVEKNRGGSAFERELKKFSRNRLRRLAKLLQRELAPEAGETPAATPAESDGGQVSPEQRADAERLQVLVAQFESAARELGSQRLSTETFDTMVSLFEEMFYRIDKRTLYAVNRSRDRVNAFRDLLESLAEAHSDAA